jgi:hypothetical protein
MNTEKFVVMPKGNKYINLSHRFSGTMKEAEQYATAHNFGGGVDVFIPSIRVRSNKEDHCLRD